MGAPRGRKRRWIWWVVIPAAVLAAAAVTLIYLLGGRSLSTRYDDAPAVLTAYAQREFPAVAVRPDGSGELRLGKEDLYWLGDRLGVSDRIRDAIAEDGAVTDAGFRLSEGRVYLYLGRRAARLLPIPLAYKAEMAFSFEDGAIFLHTERVWLGTRLNAPERIWPTLLRQGMRIDLSETELGAEITDAWLEGNALVMELRGLNVPIEGTVSVDRELETVRRFFGDETGRSPAVLAFLAGSGGEFSMEELLSFAAGTEDLRAALVETLSLCTPDSAARLWEGRGELMRSWLWGDLARDTIQRRADLDHFLAAEQSRYERLLFAVREMYRSGALGVDESFFFNTGTGERVGPETLSKLSVSATDSRIVFLFSAYDTELTREDMPSIGGLWTKSLRSLKDLAWDDVVDLGIVLPTETDVPVLLHRRADGTLAIRELSEERYVAVLVSRGIPRVDLDVLPVPGEELRRPAGEGWTGAALLLLSAGG